MSIPPSEIESTVVDFLQRLGKLPEGFGPETPLYSGGAELDSLETAELSATLEDTHGVDPFAAGPMPGTLQDILDAFARATA